MRKWAEAQDRSLFFLSCELMEAYSLQDIIQSGVKFFDDHTQTESEAFYLKFAFTCVLASMPSYIVKSLIRGDLRRNLRSNASFGLWNARDVAAARNVAANDIPGVYVNFITTSTGLHPTIADTHRILDLMELYYNLPANDPMVEGIDSEIAPWQSASQPRRYDRKLDTLAFVVAARARISTGAPTNHVLGGFPEVGWSRTPKDRIRQHAKHTSSNTIMNLFEACSMHLFVQKYRMHGVTVCRVSDPQLAHAAEILVTCLTQAWFSCGLGFTHHWPGQIRNVPIDSSMLSVWIDGALGQDYTWFKEELEKLCLQ